MASSGSFDLRSLYDALSKSIEVKDRKKNFKKFPQCFLGSEAVDYLVNTQLLPRREQAIAIAQDMLDNKMIKAIHPVTQPSLFQDSASYYYAFAAISEFEIRRDPSTLYPTIQDVLTSTVGTYYFRQFAQGRHLVNYDFLIEATEFYNQHVLTTNADEVRQAAQKIYDVYFRQDSLTRVEASTPVMDDVDATMAYATFNIFERAILEVSDSMKDIVIAFHNNPYAERALLEITDHNSQEAADLYIQRVGVSFDEVIESSEGSKHFMSFLESEYCSETLKFYQDATHYASHPNDYKDMPHVEVEDPTSAPAAALAMFDQYIKVGSPEEVNIGTDLKNEIESKLSAATGDLFAAAARTVYQLMSFENGPYSRFIKKTELLYPCIQGMRKEERRRHMRKVFPSLRLLLKAPVGVRYLRMFLETEFCAELLFCWEETQKFHDNSYKLQTRSKLLHKNHARKIYNTFLMPSADNAIEIPSSTRASIEAGLTEPTAELFVPLQQECLDQMQALWHPFCQSALGDELANVVFR